MPSTRREKKKVLYALSGSVLIHLLVVITLGAIFAYRPEPPAVEPEPEPEVAELTIIPPPPPPQSPPPFIDVPPDRIAEEKPETPDFESAENSAAASEAAADNASDLPAQEGRESEAIELVDRDYTAGDSPQAGSPAAPVPPTPTNIPEPTPPRDEPPASTPVPPPPDSISLLPPEPTPTPVEEKPEEKEKTEESELPKPPTQPARPSLPGYQPEERRTKIEGTIDSRGKTSVDAEATPLGKYKKQLSDAIGSRWYFYTKSQIDKISIGTAKVKFFVAEDGDVEDVEILSNDSNEIFATYTLQAIMEAEITDIPADIADTLPGRRLEVEYTFTVYGR